jgi:hypothetical protein
LVSANAENAANNGRRRKTQVDFIFDIMIMELI